MIRLLLALQLIASAVYYLTSPFNLNAAIVFFWLINSASCALLILHYRQLYGDLSPKIKKIRLVFTLTLIFVEIAINATADSYAADNFHGFISDSEVLLTGMSIGALWHYELTKRLTKAS